ncbi:MAG: hypothetical protein HYZ54_07300 [Ignavibacteriae bacterium]|nr:hypothetical protein [Ignavibacteriota bacterium]
MNQSYEGSWHGGVDIYNEYQSIAGCDRINSCFFKINPTFAVGCCGYGNLPENQRHYIYGVADTASQIISDLETTVIEYRIFFFNDSYTTRNTLF